MTAEIKGITETNDMKRHHDKREEADLFQHHTPSKPFLPIYKRVPKPKPKCDRGMHPPGFLSLSSASGVVIINRCLEF